MWETPIVVLWDPIVHGSEQREGDKEREGKTCLSLRACHFLPGSYRFAAPIALLHCCVNLQREGQRCWSGNVSGTLSLLRTYGCCFPLPPSWYENSNNNREGDVLCKSTLNSRMSCCHPFPVRSVHPRGHLLRSMERCLYRRPASHRTTKRFFTCRMRTKTFLKTMGHMASVRRWPCHFSLPPPCRRCLSQP